MSMAHKTGPGTNNSVNEQLRLFYVEETAVAMNGHANNIAIGATKRERLAQLLAGDLEFHGQNTSYASHDLHAFAAKFPPQLPAAFIRALSDPGDLVLDPMSGSGTTIVEAVLAGRHGVGLDIDPLALRLSRVKTMPVELEKLQEAGYKVLFRANDLIQQDGLIDGELAARFDERTKTFIDYWFLPATQRELLALVLSIEEVNDPLLRRFLELTFSSIIITKSGGVSLARDLAHSRPHLDKTKSPRNVLEQFAARLRKNLTSIGRLKADLPWGITMAADARSMPLANNSVHLIVTSPPYANALDYMRAHKFSLVWLGAPISDLGRLRAEYIGSERSAALSYGGLPTETEQVITRLGSLDSGKAAILRKYFLEMKDVIAEMYRVLREDGAAIIVVGTSTMRGLDVATHCCLAEIASEQRFNVVGIAKRNLDRNRRMMPARFGKKSDSMIEQRMHDEYVIGLLKASDVGGESNAIP